MHWQKTILPQKFYDRDPIVVAQELLGKFLVRKTDDQYLVGRITETEAYLASGDSAAHNFKGRTKRNESLYKNAGHAYVFSLRHHYLIDIVTEGPDIPSSVLIRGIEPVDGIEEMKRLRKTEDIENLTNGPAKLCAALAITKKHDGITITDPHGELFISSGPTNPIPEIKSSGRIGISSAQDMMLRFYIKGNKYVSKRR